MKATEIAVLDLRKLSDVADYFVLATGQGAAHVQAVAAGLRQDLRREGVPVLGDEGFAGREWILIDLGGVIVHVFQSELRAYYDLEGLWGDSRKVPWSPGRKAKAGAKA